MPPTATETAVVNVNTGKNTKNSASNLFPNSTTSSKAKSTSCLIQTARPGNTIKTTRTKAEAEYTYSKELREAKRNEGTHEILEVDLRAQPKAPRPSGALKAVARGSSCKLLFEETS